MSCLSEKTLIRRLSLPYKRGYAESAGKVNSSKSCDLKILTSQNFQMNLSLLLSALFLQLLVVSNCEARSRNSEYRLATSGSSSTPATFASQKAGSRVHCSGLCSVRAGCFGFCWLTSARGCRLFTVSAYFNGNSWTDLTAEKCDIYVPIINTTIRKLAFSGCNQSSTQSGGVCSRAIDGDTRRIYPQGSCSHTGYQASEWWEGKLSQQAMVSSVTIYNRQDCCAERLNNFELLVDGVVCNEVNITVAFSVTNLSCWQLQFGSRVRLLNRQVGAFSICEIEAFGFVFSGREN